MTAAVTAWWTAWVLGCAAWGVKEYLLSMLDSEPLALLAALLAGFASQVILGFGALLCGVLIGQIQRLTDECLEDVADAR
jgi:hypothetical protein